MEKNRCKKKEKSYTEITDPIPNEELILQIMQKGMEILYGIMLYAEALERSPCRRISRAMDAVAWMMAKASMELAEVKVTNKRVSKIKSLLKSFTKEDAVEGNEEPKDAAFHMLVCYYDSDRLKCK